MLTVAVCLAATGSAWAHVTPQPPSFPKGASDVIMGFAVPNETTDNSSTVKVEIDIPTDHPITGVHADAMAAMDLGIGRSQRGGSRPTCARPRVAHHMISTLCLI